MISVSAARFVHTSEIENAVAEAIAAAKDADQLAKVHVLVQNGRAGQWLARSLARAGGVINTRFVTMTWLADALLKEAPGAVSESAHLSGDVRRELARIVCTGARPPLDSHASPVVVNALAHAFVDLRNRPESEVEALADVSPLMAEIVRLFGQFRALSSVRFSDGRDRIEQATASISGDTPAVVAVVDEVPVAHELDLLHALHRHQRLQLIVVSCGDERLDEVLRFGLTGFGLEARAVAENAGDREVVIAPDAEVEVQLGIARLLKEARAGVGFNRMALAFTNAAPYATIVNEQMRAAGIPINGRSPARLSQSVAGRFISGLLDVIDDDFATESVAGWINSAPIRHQDQQVDGARWTRLAQLAGVISGVEQWVDRLRAYAGSLRKSEEREEASAAADFFADLNTWCAVEFDRWTEWSTWLQESINKYLGTADERAPWPRKDAEAALQVEQAILRLHALGEIGAPCDRVAVAAALKDQLIAARNRERAPSGVSVGTLGDVRGSQYDLLIVCGVAESLAPARSVNEGFGFALQVPGEERDTDEDRRQFLLALAAAQTVVLSCPRVDQRAQREMRPSPWLLHEASRMAGERVSADELIEANNRFDWLTVVPSFAGALAALSETTDQLQELSSLALGQSLDSMNFSHSHLQRGFDAVQSRTSGEATRFDGITGAHPAASLTGAGPISVTGLESWAECPFRYFLSSVLEVERPVDMDDPLRLAAKDRGLLVHETLEQFIRQVAPRTSPSQVWSDSERHLLHSIGDELYEQARNAGRSPQGLLWEAELRALHDNLEGFLDVDIAVRKEHGVMPDRRDVEVGFGAGSARQVEVARNNGVPVVFRGRVDRIDVSPERDRALAIDYKTGNSKYFPSLRDDPLAKGTKLQLALYAEAVESALPGAAIDATYWFVADSANQYPRLTVHYDGAVKARLEDVVGSISDGVETGVFPPVPGKEVWDTYENCRKCPYDRVRTADRGEAWERKQNDPAVEPFMQLSKEEQ